MLWKKISLISAIVFASVYAQEAEVEQPTEVVETEEPVAVEAPKDEYCWALAYGYPCCKDTTTVWAVDESGSWGYENDSWCGIEDLYEEDKENCWASILNYPCCEGNKVIETDEYGTWGFEFGQWCGIKQAEMKDPTKDKTKYCWSVEYGYPCCLGSKVVETDYNGDWGFENGEWCGIPRTVVPEPEYTVLYADTEGLPDTTGDYSWGAEISYADGCMSGTIDEGTWGALSLKFEGEENFSNGSLRFDVKSSFDNAPINVSAQKFETEESTIIAKVAASTEWKTVTVDIDFPEYNRFFFQVGSTAAQTISIRNVVVSTGSAAEFTYGEVAGGDVEEEKIVPIYIDEDFFPSSFQNWSWETDVYCADGEMIITTDPSSDKKNQASLSIFTPINFSNGAIKFDIRAPVDGTLIYFSVFEADTDRMVHISEIVATPQYKTYVFDIPCDDFIRFNFQDANGEGITFNLKNVYYARGSSADFNEESEIISIYGTEDGFPSGYFNWSWDTELMYDEGMIITIDAGNHGALSIVSPDYFTKGLFRFDLKAVDSASINFAVTDTELGDWNHIETIDVTNEWTTFTIKVDHEKYNRINFQDAIGEGAELQLRNLKYTTGSFEKKGEITTIYSTEDGFPEGYYNWSWDTELMYEEGEGMIVTVDAGNHGALSLVGPVFSNGAFSFDMKCAQAGKGVNFAVAETVSGDWFHIDTATTTEEWTTYTFDVNIEKFDRINFQDADGEGIEFYLRNIKYTTGTSADFE